MFEESVVNTPDRIAIVYGYQQLSYETLNKKANQLAHYLVEQGVSLETPVAISMARCPDLIIGLLAILKAGGAYVPLDPEYPRERLAYMLSDSGARLLLTHVSIKEKLHRHHSLLICLDDASVQRKLLSKPRTNPTVSIPPDSLCYIIYTSGSTGRPKGISCKHVGMTNRLHYPNTLVVPEEASIGCLQSNAAFADAMWDIFSIITNSSTLLLYKENISKDIKQAIDLWGKYHVSRATITPSVIQVISKFNTR